MAADEQDRVIPDEERARQILDQLKSVHAFDLAYETMVGLVNFGSQKMGLLEETREVRDLDDAHLSIELVRAILEVVEREQGAERTRGLHDALAQMQLAYAHAVQLVNAERAAEREGTAAEPAPQEPAAGEPAQEAAEGGVPADEAAEGGVPADEAADAGEPGTRSRTRRKPAAKKRPAAAKKKPAAQQDPAPGRPAGKKKPAATRSAGKKKPAGEG